MVQISKVTGRETSYEGDRVCSFCGEKTKKPICPKCYPSFAQKVFDWQLQHPEGRQVSP